MITEDRLRLVIRAKVTALVRGTRCEYAHVYGRLRSAIPGDGRGALLEKSKLLTTWQRQISAGNWQPCRICTGSKAAPT
jgi:hypothetical protein